MTSADFSCPFPLPLDTGSLKAGHEISPGKTLRPSRLSPPHIHTYPPYRYWALEINASSPDIHASYAVSVRRGSALPAASFRPRLTAAALAVRLTVPPVGPVEDSHLQVGVPCRAHTKKAASLMEAALSSGGPTWTRTRNLPVMSRWL